MKIVTVSAVRNEEDIIEAFVRYHLQFVDHVLLVNHRSSDTTGRILGQLKKEGLPVETSEETSLDFQQEVFLTTLMKKAVWEHDADWVIPLDADEFLAPAGNGDVRSFLENLSRDKVVTVPWRTYIPLASDDRRERNVLKRIRSCRAREPIPFRKVVIPRALARRSNAFIEFGSHGFARRSLWKAKQCPRSDTDRLVLAHYPVRSAQQIMTKAFLGWLACLAKPNRLPTESYHLKTLYDLFAMGNTLSDDQLTSLAFGYATREGTAVPGEGDILLKPLSGPADAIALRYSVAQPSIAPLTLLATLGEDLAEALATTRRKGRRRLRCRAGRPNSWP